MSFLKSNVLYYTYPLANMAKAIRAARLARDRSEGWRFYLYDMLYFLAYHTLQPIRRAWLDMYEAWDNSEEPPARPGEP